MREQPFHLWFALKLMVNYNYTKWTWEVEIMYAFWPADNSHLRIWSFFGREMLFLVFINIRRGSHTPCTYSRCAWWLMMMECDTGWAHQIIGIDVCVARCFLQTHINRWKIEFFTKSTSTSPSGTQIINELMTHICMLITWPSFFLLSTLFSA